MRSLIPHTGTDFQCNFVTQSLTDFTDCGRVGRRAACPHCLKPNRQLETEEGNFARSRDEGTSDGSSFTLLNVRVYCFFASSSSLCAAASPSSAVCPATSLSLQHYLEESVRELYGGIIKFARRNEGRQGKLDGRYNRFSEAFRWSRPTTFCMPTCHPNHTFWCFRMGSTPLIWPQISCAIRKPLHMRNVRHFCYFVLCRFFEEH